MQKRTHVPYGVAQRFVGAPVADTGHDSRFRVTGGDRVTDVPMQRDEMRRLFHLGYAFNLRQLKYLEFGASVMIGSVDAPEFQRNLRRVKELVNDPGTHAICDKVLAAFLDSKAEYVVGIKVAERK